MMPRILDQLLAQPPKVFVIQTRGPLIVRDLARLVELSRRTTLRVSFSITTNREAVRKLYEPHCATLDCRLKAIRELRQAGITTFATLAPILPCDPEELARMALEATDQDIIGDRFAYPIGKAARRNYARGRVRDQPRSMDFRSGWNHSFSAMRRNVSRLRCAGQDGDSPRGRRDLDGWQQ